MPSAKSVVTADIDAKVDVDKRGPLIWCDASLPSFLCDSPTTSGSVFQRDATYVKVFLHS